MAQLTALLDSRRHRFVVVELRALGDGSAELHRYEGRVGGHAGHTADEYSTLRLAQSARAEAFEAFRRRGYVRALGARGDGASAVTWDTLLADAIAAASSRAVVRAHVPTERRQLDLPLAG